MGVFQLHTDVRRIAPIAEMAVLVEHEEFERRLPDLIAQDWHLARYFHFTHDFFNGTYMRLADFVRLFSAHIGVIKLWSGEALLYDQGIWNLSALSAVARSGAKIRIDLAYDVYENYARKHERSESLETPEEDASKTIIQTLNHITASERSIAAYFKAPLDFEFNGAHGQTILFLPVAELIGALGSRILDVVFISSAGDESLLLLRRGAWNPAALKKLSEAYPRRIFLIADHSSHRFGVEQMLSAYAVKASEAIRGSLRALCKNKKIAALVNIPRDFGWTDEIPFVTLRLPDLVEALGSDVINISLTVHADSELWLLRHGQWDINALAKYVRGGRRRPVTISTKAPSMESRYAAKIQAWVDRKKADIARKFAFMVRANKYNYIAAADLHFQWYQDGTAGTAADLPPSFTLPMPDLLRVLGSDILFITLTVKLQDQEHVNVLRQGTWSQAGLMALNTLHDAESQSRRNSKLKREDKYEIERERTIFMIAERPSMIPTLTEKLMHWLGERERVATLGGLRRHPDTTALSAARARRRSRSWHASRSRSQSKRRSQRARHIPSAK